ncbi:pentapeptide repeat-containing protein [Streptomyces specialis]|uniref:pentapeptide repeat-containing protein n=1 Tax=Streptomyces specialis TaxID=498367 RepID=UPI00073F5FAA|nr:pentapeptide repeat-containing protein [Streptomyces specialis]
MRTHTLGRLTLTLPTLDDLPPAVPLTTDKDTHLDFHYTGSAPRTLHLDGARLISGRITGLATHHTQLHNTRLDGVEFTDCDLGSLHWTDSTLTHTVFRDCTLTGARLDRLTLDNVLFENCALDYATLHHLRATGPLALVKCDLTEAAVHHCDFTNAHLEACGLHHTTFTAGTYHHTDLRGNDLSTLRGAMALKAAIIDRPQHPELTHALTTELNPTFPDTLDDYER